MEEVSNCSLQDNARRWLSIDSRFFTGTKHISISPLEFLSAEIQKTLPHCPILNVGGGGGGEDMVNLPEQFFRKK